MGYDAVRDAINSPTIQSPSGFSAFPLPPSTSSTSLGSPASPLIGSPSLSRRRATDLSVLLNADDNPRPARRSSLTHLLHHDEHNKLSTSQPLRRNEADNEYEYRPSSSSSHLTAQSPVPDSPSHSPFFSRPSSSSSSFPRSTVSPIMPPPPLPPTTIPYNPRQRISPAVSVLKPMSQTEMVILKQYVGQGTQRLMKRKRDRSSESEARDQPPAKRHEGDVNVVVQHYNSRPDVGVVQRQDSPIIGLKNFNNWVKSVLISRFAHPALHARPGGMRHTYAAKGQSGKVLDMGCGKGGDITKWAKARVKDYVGADIATISIDQARGRHESFSGRRFNAKFAALDCYTEPLSSAFGADVLRQPFDVVSMQFCMHYAFETEKKARCMLENVTRWLRPGGVFIGTIPNADLLLARLDEIPEDNDLSFGNEVYKIRFEDRVNRPLYGHKYWFFLEDAVGDVPEYVVYWKEFVDLAAEYGLHPTYKAEFHQVYEDYSDHPDFGPLMIHMKVRDEAGESSMDEAQWDAANIYIAFAFEKR